MISYSGLLEPQAGRTSVSGHDPRADNDFVPTTVGIVGGFDSSGEQLVGNGVFVRRSEWRGLQTCMECITDGKFAIGFSGAICNVFTKCTVREIKFGREALQCLSIALLDFLKRATRTCETMKRGLMTKNKPISCNPVVYDSPSTLWKSIRLYTTRD